MSDKPIYSSKRSVKSLWQRYHIYQDHLELATLFGRLRIPFQQIEQVEIAESDVKRFFNGDFKLKNVRSAIKLDWADFIEHLVVDKAGGIFKRIVFTPDDVREFKRVLDAQVELFRKRERGTEE